jgi:putative hydrolase of the HAD superfamily
MRWRERIERSIVSKRKPAAITCLFVDIGGVLLTDGWDHHSRRRAAKRFGLNWAEMEERHNQNFAIFEEGRLTLEIYLDRVVFYEKRSFSRAEFRRFLFEQSKPYPAMIEIVRTLKAAHGLKIFVVSNESRELNAYRIEKFGLDRFVDGFISSCYVGMRKPDEGIFRLALDIAQVPAGQIVFVDNTAMFVQIAEGLGMNGIVHVDYKTTCAKLDALGLRNGGAAHGGGPVSGKEPRIRRRKRS